MLQVIFIFNPIAHPSANMVAGSTFSRQQRPASIH